MILKLNVYDEDFVNVKKECEANTVKLPFGLVRRLMALFEKENIESTDQILKIVTGSWGTIVHMLNGVFPDIEEEDWDYVDTAELVAVVWTILKDKFGEILSIPVNSKN